MSRQKHTAEEIINKLREAEVLQAKGMSIEEVMRQLGISDATYYHNVMASPQVAEGVWRATG
jgi:predicted transcriptional regulator YheO